MHNIVQEKHFKIDLTKEATNVENEQFVVFKLDFETYLVSILQVKEILSFTKVTKLPSVEEYIEGVINLRGKLLPVLNLGEILGVYSKKENDKKIIVVDVGNRTIGCIVDEVTEVKTYKNDEIEKPPVEIVGENSFITGITKDENEIFILIDFVKIYGGIDCEING